VFNFSQYAPTTQNLHLDTSMGCTRRRSITSGASATRRIPVAEICSTDGYLLAAFTSASEEGLAVPHLVEAQNS
jgi:hypothetical protein